MINKWFCSKNLHTYCAQQCGLIIMNSLYYSWLLLLSPTHFVLGFILKGLIILTARDSRVNVGLRILPKDNLMCGQERSRISLSAAWLIGIFIFPLSQSHLNSLCRSNGEIQAPPPPKQSKTMYIFWRGYLWKCSQGAWSLSEIPITLYKCYSHFWVMQ